jgi:6-pyruvoyl tetrahydropterin synthase/QueD family protein
METVSIRHNVEMGHRLSLQPNSKCFCVHGHTWWIEIEVGGPPDPYSGMILSFTEIKSKLRPWLDANFDHHTLLNTDDPLWKSVDVTDMDCWGFVPFPIDSTDPTVENFARLIYHKCQILWPEKFWRFRVTVQEGPTNKATYGDW